MKIFFHFRLQIKILNLKLLQTLEKWTDLYASI